MIKVAFVLLGIGSIGGAQKRIANIFNYLSQNTSKNEYEFFLILSQENYDQLIKIIPKFGKYNLIIRPRLQKGTLVTNKNFSNFINPNPNKKRFKFLRNIVNELLEWKRLIKDAFFLRGAYKKYNIDIAHTVWHGAFATSLLKFFSKRPYHVLSYMSSSHYSVSLKLRNIPISYYLSLSTADVIDFLAESYHKSLIMKFPSIKLKKYDVSPNSFTIRYSTDLSTRKKNKVVFAARLENGKNPFLFIDVADEILKTRKDIEFEIYGKGPTETAIKKYLYDKDLESKIKFSFTYEMENVFRESKIFLSLQLVDNYPSQSVLEAMYWGNVIIATNVGDTYKLVNNDHGFLVDFNITSIAEKIIFLIDNPESFEVYSKKSCEFVRKNHNIENYSKYILNLYNKLKTN